MTISGGIFVLQQVYNKQVAKTWPKVFFFQEYSWIGGGAPNTSTVERYSLTNDTESTTYRGNLDYAARVARTFGVTDRGWFGGGYLFPQTYYSNVSRITYSSDTQTAISRGKIAYNISSQGATNNSDYGWFGGGNNAPGATQRSFVSRLVFSTDSSNMTSRGPLNSSRGNVSGFGNNLYGWFIGGGPSGAATRVDRITYSSDTVNASSRQPLINFATLGDSSGNDVYIWHFGADSVTSIQRITMDNDLISPVTRGNIRLQTTSVVATENSTDTWLIFGTNIDKYNHSNDTETTTLRSYSLINRSQAAATSAGRTN
jgi:hypothetical protein